jgi:hypothetical protein
MDHPTQTTSSSSGADRGRSSQPSIAILDEALQRVSALDFEIPNPFVNHAPMACEALAALHLDWAIDAWADRYETSMRRAVQPVASRWQPDFDWTEYLGDFRLLPEWMGYFGQAIDDEGWRTVVERWVPRLMPGLASALFHGVIRTSHAVRAIEAADTEARRAELARALGNWAIWFAPGASVNHGLRFEDPPPVVLRAAAHGAGCYVAEPTIFNLHGVTGAMAVQLLIGYLSPTDALAAVVQLQAEHVALYRGVTQVRGDGEATWSDQSVVAASTSYDAHQIKLVEACHRGFEMTGDPAFSLAAQTVTS